ncbi:Phosphatidylserine decarboxylase proenzyme [Leucoagaricus sp. SymC.cos]|nr:Phosphatidylserine decarboxylase proenzyme [Leucoagaricus sp. SymC.cos]
MLHPTVRDFQRSIEDDPDMYMGFQQMFEQVPNTTKYQTDLAGIGPQIRSYQHMLYRLNQVLSWAPTYGDGTFPFVPLPMTAMFTWPTCTSAGYRMFTNDLVNAHFKLILTAWAHFLSTPASRYTLSAAEGGWFSSAALQAMPNFTTTFVCNPEEEFFGYKSFDDFFTRELQEGVRPVDAPDDDSVIGNACESSPYNIGRNVKERDMFWIKGEPYSLRHMLNNDESTSQFIGGTVYQAFLFATSYHRWHSPVNGKIVKVVHVQGTYFSISTALGFEASSDPDPVAAGYSQAYMTSMATRMLIFIQADNPKIGLMAFGAVGMVEVSSMYCEEAIMIFEIFCMYIIIAILCGVEA